MVLVKDTSTSWPSLLIHPLSFVSSLGSRCNEPCSEGLWGRHCNQTCFKHCPNSDTCLRETGACVCRPGYWGVTCQNSECCSDLMRSDQKLPGFAVERRPSFAHSLSLVSQNAELVCMATSAACRVRPVASRTAATM